MRDSKSYITRCSRCLMPASVPGISFVNNLCSECLNHQPESPKGEKALDAEVKDRSKGDRAYDCVVPISGGLDSVYTVFYLSMRMGLRCRGVHYDNGFGSVNKLSMLDWIEKVVGVPIAVYRWTESDSRSLVRDSVQALLPFGAKSLQAALCRHCGYGIRAAVYSEMVKWNVHSVWGKHRYDHIPFRYCEEVPFARVLLQRNGIAAIRSFARRLAQMRSIPPPGNSILRTMFSPMGYPSMPKSHAHLKNISFYSYIPWNKNSMMEDLSTNGVDIRYLVDAHSDCILPSIVDRVLQSAWTAGKKEIYICNMVREGLLTKNDGLDEVQALRDSEVDTSILKHIGLKDDEIVAMFLKVP